MNLLNWKFKANPGHFDVDLILEKRGLFTHKNARIVKRYKDEAVLSVLYSTRIGGVFLERVWKFMEQQAVDSWNPKWGRLQHMLVWHSQKSI